MIVVAVCIYAVLLPLSLLFAIGAPFPISIHARNAFLHLIASAAYLVQLVIALLLLAILGFGSKTILAFLFWHP